MHNPKLFFLGMQDQWFTFNMFDAQAWWVRDVVMGRIAVPADKAVLAEGCGRPNCSMKMRGQDAHDAIHYQGDYVKELIAETDYPSFDVDGACQAFYDWKDHKKKDIMTFRDNAYKSVITGTMAPLHHTPWKDALEDSMESYLRKLGSACFIPNGSGAGNCAALFLPLFSTVRRRLSPCSGNILSQRLNLTRLGCTPVLSFPPSGRRLRSGLRRFCVGRRRNWGLKAEKLGSRPLLDQSGRIRSKGKRKDLPKRCCAVQ